jgi:hypothetical protein
MAFLSNFIAYSYLTVDLTGELKPTIEVMKITGLKN